MNEKLKNFFKALGVFLAGIVTAIFGFFIGRRNVSNIRDRIDDIDEQLGTVGDGIAESEDISKRSSNIIKEGTGIVTELEDELRKSAESADALADSVERQSDRLAESKRIIDNVKKRGKFKPE